MICSRKYGILIQGEKGLVGSDFESSKMCFPDRSWIGAKVGVYNNEEVTVNKEKFNFIKGDMLETLPFDGRDAYDIYQRKCCIDSCYVIDLGGTEILYCIEDAVCYIYHTMYIKTKDHGIEEVYKFVFSERGIRNPILKYVHDLVLNDECKKLSVHDVAQELYGSEDDIIRIINGMTCIGEAVLYNNKILESSMSCRNTRVQYKTKGITFKDMNGQIVQIRSGGIFGTDYRLNKNVADLHFDEEIISKFLLENNISFADFTPYNVNNERTWPAEVTENVEKYLVGRRVESFGQSINLYMFRASTVTKEILMDETLNSIVYDSIKEVKQLKSRVLKIINKKTMGELKTFDYINDWQLR